MDVEKYNLTGPQKSIWYTEQFYQNTPINNIEAYLFVDDNVNFNLFRKAILKFIESNDIFRAKFYVEKTSPYQKILNFDELDYENNIEFVDLQSTQELEDLAKEMVNTPFTLIDSYLFDFKIFKLPNNQGGFILNAHHLIVDAWSAGLVVDEIIDNYSSLLEESDLEQRTFSYTNYIVSENSYKQSNKYLKDKEFWNSKLSYIPEIASFPSSKKHINQDDFSSIAERKQFTLDLSLINKVNNYCKEQNISVFNFFMSIISVYLYKTTGLDRFIIGAPFLNRTGVKEKNTLGMFVNTLPFAVSLDSSLSFSEFSKEIARESMSILRHQKYPYQDLLNDLRAKNDSLSSLYSVLLSYQNVRNNRAHSSISYHTNWISNNIISNLINIHISDMDDTGSLNILYDYNLSKYSPEDIIDLHLRLIHIINTVLQNNSIIIKDIEIITEEEKNILLNNFIDANYDKYATVTSLFEEQVIKFPDNIAVLLNGDNLTYKELNDKANSLAHFLTQKKVGLGDKIALRMDKSFEMIISILAIIKCGATYVPINLSYPESRVQFMLNDSNSKLLLFIEEDDMFSSLEIDKLNVSLSNTDIYNVPCCNLNYKINPEDDLYIIYTSGSTGTPKGALISHKNVVRLLKNDKILFDFNENDVWTMFHSVAFDFSVWEIYGALLYGGTLVLVDDKTAKNPVSFLELLRNENVTILNQTPTYFYNLQDYELCLSNNNLNLRYIIFGGEALKPSLIVKWKNKYPNTKFINMYGITETTVHVTFKELSGNDFNSSDSMIGIPIPTLKVYVLDRDLKMLPYFCEGEMFVAGDGLCKGYLNRPDLNKEKFIVNPYNQNEILYSSADSAYWNKSNELIYCGRIDNQVKIRGFRVELCEIEEKILGYGNISKCVVLPRQINNKDTLLVAYIVSNENINISDLKNYLSPLLPSYMIPNFYLQIDKMPLNVNGKVDRKYLDSLDLSIETGSDFEKPRNNFEKVLKNIIENSLGIKNLSINDNILDIGADSLTLMNITIALLKKNYILNIQDIYKYKTIKNISDHIQNPVSTKKELSEELIYNFDHDFSDEKLDINNILLTGATGFLGIHILYELLKNSNYNVYCLVREKNSKNPLDRLIEKLNFYFSEDLSSLINKRIFVVDGNIIDENLAMTSSDYLNLGLKIDIVIHSAALVSHYGDEELFNKININGTKNIIDFCTKFNIHLNYISTMSIAYPFGNKLTKTFNENSLYIGQNYIDNIYIHTKLISESLILDSINNGSLSATVFRLGNITGRYSDGLFQYNYNNNAFLSRILSFAKLGKAPKSLANSMFDFSPVDICSYFIVRLLEYKSNLNKVFHISNNNEISLKQLFTDLKSCGINVELVDDNLFDDLIRNSEKNSDLLGIINDLTNHFVLGDFSQSISSDFTLDILDKLNLHWPKIDSEYLQKYLKKFL